MSSIESSWSALFFFCNCNVLLIMFSFNDGSPLSGRTVDPFFIGPVCFDGIYALLRMQKREQIRRKTSVVPCFLGVAINLIIYIYLLWDEKDI
mmetsp:Transcript_22872/g.33771  ORF Transcript_22872/g.33771 Transcript_22872/m.33771 type:complete len:93 (+) Transcript_22872:94-372(+)